MYYKKLQEIIVKGYLIMPVNTIYKKMHKTEKSINKKVKIFREKVRVNCTLYRSQFTFLLWMS